MPKKRQLEESFTMLQTKRTKPDEGFKEAHILADSVALFRDTRASSEVGADLNNYEAYKRGLHECEQLFGMINKLDIIEDINQDKSVCFKCPLCLQAFPELFQLSSHKCIFNDLDLFHDRTRSSNASIALTSTRKDIGDLLNGIPSSKFPEQFGLTTKAN